MNAARPLQNYTFDGPIPQSIRSKTETNELKLVKFACIILLRPRKLFVLGEGESIVAKN